MHILSQEVQEGEFVEQDRILWLKYYQVKQGKENE